MLLLIGTSCVHAQKVAYLDRFFPPIDHTDFGYKLNTAVAEWSQNDTTYSVTFDYFTDNKEKTISAFIELSVSFKDKMIANFRDTIKDLDYHIGIHGFHFLELFFVNLDEDHQNELAFIYTLTPLSFESPEITSALVFDNPSATVKSKKFNPIKKLKLDEDFNNFSTEEQILLYAKINLEKDLDVFYREHELIKGKMATISVDECLYLLNEGNFLLKFKVVNTSNETIGIDLKKQEKIYLNQWNERQNHEMLMINEKRLPLDTVNPTEINAKFEKSELTFLRPGRALIYLLESEKSYNQPSAKLPENDLVMHFDGQLVVTNGKEIECLKFEPKNEANRVFLFNNPASVKLLPRRILVFEN